MKIHNYYIILVLISLVFFSCYKDDENDPEEKEKTTGIHISKIYPLRGQIESDNTKTNNSLGEYYVSGALYDTTKCYFYPPTNSWISTKNGVFLQKFNNSDELIWQKRWNWKDEKISCIVSSEDKGAFLATYNRNMIVRKIDPSGLILWKKELGDRNEPDYIYRMVSTKDGGVLCTSKTETFSDEGYGDIMNFKLNRDGELIWQDIYEDIDQEIPHDIILTDDGGCLVIGENNGKEIFASVLIIIKYDKNGNREWVKNLKLNDWTVGMSAIILSNKDIIIGGRSYRGGTYSNSFLLCLDKTGEKKWFKEMDEYPMNEFGKLLIPLDNDNFVFVVNTVDRIYFSEFDRYGEFVSRQSIEALKNKSVSVFNNENELTVFYNFEKIISDTTFYYINYTKLDFNQ